MCTRAVEHYESAFQSSLPLTVRWQERVTEASTICINAIVIVQLVNQSAVLENRA